MSGVFVLEKELKGQVPPVPQPFSAAEGWLALNYSLYPNTSPVTSSQSLSGALAVSVLTQHQEYQNSVQSASEKLHPATQQPQDLLLRKFKAQKELGVS